MDNTEKLFIEVLRVKRPFGRVIATKKEDAPLNAMPILNTEFQLST